MAGFSLLFMTISDYTKRMVIDQRRNMIMIGAGIMLLPYLDRGILYLLGCVGISVLLTVFLSKVEALGGSDVTTIGWLFYGLALISVWYLIVYFTAFLFLTVVYHAVIFYVIRTRVKLPFYPVFLASFVILIGVV